MHSAADSECLGQRRRTHRLTVQGLHSSTQYSLTRNTPQLIITGKLYSDFSDLKALQYNFCFQTAQNARTYTEKKNQWYNNN